jgi:hypothetical protein
MFRNCEILLHQNWEPDKPNTERWLQIVLLKPTLEPLPDGGDDAAMAEWGRMLIEYPWKGNWYPKASSVGKIDSQYTIGTSLNQEFKYWRWGFSGFSGSWELQFVEAPNMVGGGLKFGESVKVLEVAMALYGANITARGIEPFDASGTGRGYVNRGSAILKQGSVNWEWAPHY